MEIRNRFNNQVIIFSAVEAETLILADLRGADLYEADLRGADLYGAELYGAELYGAIINWQSHALIAELLRRAAEDDIQKRMIAGLVAVSLDWCWDKFLDMDIPTDMRVWALDVLKGYVREGDLTAYAQLNALY